MISINSYTQGAGFSSFSSSSEVGEKKLSTEKGLTKEIVAINNSLAELNIPSNTQHHSVTGGNVPSNNQATKAGQDSRTIKKLQHKQESFEDAVERFPTCDVKIQELLKFIRADKVLWKEVEHKLEIRVIKVKDEDQEIVLHPENERKVRWFGKYHVYLTINSKGKRLIIDPYIRGDKSCAHLDEQSFMKFYWEGKEGKEYVLETIAPVNEAYNTNGDYTPEFSIYDYIDNLFDPDTFESHKFYYE